MKQIGSPQNNQKKLTEFFIPMLPSIWDSTKVYTMPVWAFGMDQVTNLVNALLSLLG